MPGADERVNARAGVCRVERGEQVTAVGVDAHVGVAATGTAGRADDCSPCPYAVARQVTVGGAFTWSAAELHCAGHTRQRTVHQPACRVAAKLRHERRQQGRERHRPLACPAFTVIL